MAQPNKDFLAVEDHEFSRDLNGSYGYSPDRPLRQEDLSIRLGEGSRSRSTSARGRLNPLEKSQMLREVEQEYKDLLRQLEEDDNVTREDIENFKKNALIHKSLLEVRRRAQAMKEVRENPQRYYQIKSRIGQNLKVSSSKQPGVNNSTMGGQSQIMFQSINSKTVTKRDNPFDITQEELARVREMQLTDKSLQKLSEREKQIHDAEQHLQELLQELKDRRPFHEKLQSYKSQERPHTTKNQKSSARKDHSSHRKENVSVTRQDQQKESSARKEEVQQSPNKTPVNVVEGKSPAKESEQSPVKTQSVQKKTREKVGMRLGGKNGDAFQQSRNEQKVTTSQTEAIKVKPKAEKQEKRLSNVGKTKKQEEQQVRLDTEVERLQDDGKVLSIVSTPKGTHQRVDIAPPAGADGCVMFIEKREQRSTSQHQAPKPETFSVAKKGQTVAQRMPKQEFVKEAPVESFTVNKKSPKKVNRVPKIDLGTPKEPQKYQVNKKTQDVAHREPKNDMVNYSVKSKSKGQSTGFNPGQAQQTLKQEPQKPQVVPLPAQKPVVEPIVDLDMEADDFKSESIQSSNQSNNGDGFGAIAKVEKEKVQREGKFHNRDLEEKTQALQDEFEKILGELNSRRMGQNGECFYQAIQEYYQEGSEAHSSPVRRLIQHKNTTFEHKKTMKDNIDKVDYAFVYTPGPGKSYVIEPHGGSINYNMAKKDPNKFYDQVFNQDLTKHTVAKDKEALKKIEEEKKQRESEGKKAKKTPKVATTVTTKVTKRPHLKIMEKLTQKIAQKLQEKLGKELGLGNILSAMKDKTVEEQIKELVAQNKLQIVDQSNNVLFDKEIKEGMGVKRQNSQVVTQKEKTTKLGVQTPSVQNEDSEMSSQAPHIEIQDADADAAQYNGLGAAGAQTKTHLKIADKDLRKIQNKVIEAHRRNSYRV